MADQELLVVVRMRDEASAVLKKWIEANKDAAKAVDATSAKVAALQRAMTGASRGAKTAGQAIGSIKGDLTTLTGALAASTKGFDTLATTAKTSGQAAGGASSRMKGLAVTLTAGAGGARATGQAIGGIGGRLMALTGPLAGGINGLKLLKEAGELVVDVYKQMVDNTIAYEKSQKMLGASLDVTGGAIGMSKGQINDVVLAQSSASRIDDTNVRNAAAELIRIGRVSKETFGGALSVSARLAEVMGTDLASASRLVARAMADPVRGMEQLREAGIELNDLEKDRIRLMELSSGRAAAQAEALSILTARLGKGGGEEGQGLSGAFEELGYAWNGFLDQFNDSWLSDLSAKVVSLTADVVNFFTVFKTKSAEAKVEARKEFIAALERDLEILNKKPLKTLGDQNLVKSLEQQIGTIRYELQRLEQDVAAAVGKGMDGAVEKAADQAANMLAKFGKTLDVSGAIVDKKVAEKEATLHRARENVKILEADYQRVLELSRQGQATKAELDVAFNRLRTANEVLKLTAEAAKTTANVIGSLPNGEGGTKGNGNDAPSGDDDGEVSDGSGSRRGRGRSGGRRPRKWRNPPKEGLGVGVGVGGGVNASKSLLDELSNIAAAMKKVEEGAYAMRRAEAEAKAARATDGTGKLQIELFEAKQALTDQKVIEGLKVETEHLQKMAAAAGDVVKQRKLLLDLEVAKATRDAAPASRPGIEEAIRGKAAADENKGNADWEAGNRKRSEDFVARQAMEREAFGRSGEAAASLRLQFDLVNQAKERGIAITPALLADFKRMSDQMAEAEGTTQRYKEVIGFAKETMKGFFTDVRANLKEGMTVWEAFGKAGLNALNKISDKLFDMITNKLIDKLFEGLLNVGSAGAGSGGGWLSNALQFVVSLFADGGIMTSRGPVPLRKYSGGGIATSPQLAMFGEGSVPEAYVPVPSGRIPVELRGGGVRGGMTVQTNISVNMTAPAGGQDSGGGSGRGNMMEQARELGAIVTAMVNKNLQDQMRPGGLLNPSGSFSAGVVQ